MQRDEEEDREMAIKGLESRLIALETRFPAPVVENAISTPARQTELAMRLAAINAATGDDLMPILERYALARSKADRDSVMHSCTVRDLHLLLVARGDCLDEEGHYTRGNFTDGEREAIVGVQPGYV